MLNINDPYRSIFQTIKVQGGDLKFAKEWLKFSTEMFNTSVDFNGFLHMFNSVKCLYNETPRISYYICPVDFTWCDMFKIDVKSTDVGTFTKEVGIRKGTFRSNITAPKLIDFAVVNIVSNLVFMFFVRWSK